MTRPSPLAPLMAITLLALSSDGAAAQSYPDHTVKIVVPSAPAGGYDVIGRLLADQLSKRLVQNVIVENRPGAGTIVGTQFVVDSPADGYTLLIGGLSNIIFNAGLYKNLRHDPMRDLVPVALRSTCPTRWSAPSNRPMRRRSRSSTQRRRTRAS